MSTADPLPGRELAAFVAAVETGSVQGAAGALMLTQSAATKRIQSLERTLGVALLTRSSQGVAPTEAGRVLYPDAKEVLAALQRAEQRVRASARADVALTLAASHTIGGFLLPGWLAAFRVVAPEIQPQVEVVNSPGVLAALARRAAEIGFVEGTDDLSAHEALALGVDEIVVVVGQGHRWSRRRSVRPAELAQQPFYAREAGSGTLAVALARLAEAGVTLRPSLQMASTQSLARAVRGGEGYTLLSRHAIEDDATLAALGVRGVDLHRPLTAIRRRGERPGPAAERLWRWLGALP